MSTTDNVYDKTKKIAIDGADEKLRWPRAQTQRVYVLNPSHSQRAAAHMLNEERKDREAADKANSVMDDARNTIKHAGDAVADTMNSAYEGTRDAVQWAGEAVTNTTGAAYECARDAVKQAGDAVSSTVSQMGETRSNQALEELSRHFEFKTGVKGVNAAAQEMADSKPLRMQASSVGISYNCLNSRRIPGETR